MAFFVQGVTKRINIWKKIMQLKYKITFINTELILKMFKITVGSACA